MQLGAIQTHTDTSMIYFRQQRLKLISKCKRNLVSFQEITYDVSICKLLFLSQFFASYCDNIRLRLKLLQIIVH